MNVDSDLYSSALTVLQWVEPYVRPDAFYLDEFCDRDHEMRAFIGMVYLFAVPVQTAGNRGGRRELVV